MPQSNHVMGTAWEIVDRWDVRNLQNPDSPMNFV